MSTAQIKSVFCVTIALSVFLHGWAIYTLESSCPFQSATSHASMVRVWIRERNPHQPAGEQNFDSSKSRERKISHRKPSAEFAKANSPSAEGRGDALNPPTLQKSVRPRNIEKPQL